MMDEGDNMKRVIELERQDAAYRVLEEAANALEIAAAMNCISGRGGWRLTSCAHSILKSFKRHGQ
jgi:hypothetical protein